MSDSNLKEMSLDYDNRNLERDVREIDDQMKLVMQEVSIHREMIERMAIACFVLFLLQIVMLVH